MRSTRHGGQLKSRGYFAVGQQIEDAMVVAAPKVTDGGRFNGRKLRDVVANGNTASEVWADDAYRS